jgi:hypothetical protein
MSALFMAVLDARKIIAESAKIVLALFAESANVSLLPLSDTNTKPKTKMHTHTSTKANATKIKTVIDRLANADCEIIRDSGSYRISDNSVSGSVFGRVRDLIEGGCKPSEITLEDVTA